MKDLSLYIAARYTLSPRKSHLLAFISRISTIGLVLAVSVLITVLSVMNGFDKELRERILSLIPHATLQGQTSLADFRPYVELAESFSGVTDAAPYSFLQSLAIHSERIRPSLMYGIDPDYEGENSVLRRIAGDAAFTQLLNPKTVLIGKGLAEKLQISEGDALRIIVPASHQQQLPSADFFTVVGILYTGTELDQKLLISHRSQLALLVGNPSDSVDGIRIQVDDLFAARGIAMQLGEVSGLHQVRDWSRTHGNLYQAIQMSRKMVVLLVLIIIAVASFNVVSTLVLAVNDKSRDIAILRTMGCTNRQVLMVFMWQGLLIGLMGISLGVVTGSLLSLFVSDVVSLIEQLAGIRFLHSDVYPVDHLPSQLQLKDVLIVASSALLLSVLASLFPAWKASKINPAQVLRHD